jgi:hypothetical protein
MMTPTTLRPAPITHRPYRAVLPRMYTPLFFSKITFPTPLSAPQQRDGWSNTETGYGPRKIFDDLCTLLSHPVGSGFCQPVSFPQALTAGPALCSANFEGSEGTAVPRKPPLTITREPRFVPIASSPAKDPAFDALPSQPCNIVVVLKGARYFHLDRSRPCQDDAHTHHEGASCLYSGLLTRRTRHAAKNKHNVQWLHVSTYGPQPGAL